MIRPLKSWVLLVSGRDQTKRRKCCCFQDKEHLWELEKNIKKQQQQQQQQQQRQRQRRQRRQRRRRRRRPIQKTLI